MDRVIIKHLDGSKANQVETILLAEHQELTFGRDPSLTIKFDPDRDDLVSRKHARIHWDPDKKEKFIITDLNSHNGVFVDDKKIVGSAEINHGDTIQLGAGGPKFVFELDPPPAVPLPPTREYQSETIRSTREAQTEASPPVRDAVQNHHDVSPNSIGRTTVQRLIFENKSESRKYLLNGAAILVGLIAVLVSIFVYYDRIEKQKNNEEDARIAAQTKALIDQQKAALVAIDQANKDLNTIRAVKQPSEI